MKKIIIPIVIIISLIVITALIFDWGRGDRMPSDINENILSTSTSIQSDLGPTDMPIFVNNIKENQIVSSPIKIEGRARGNWFFEASFPVKLVDTDGNVLAVTIAHAESDWMTTDFVNFTAYLEYNKSTSTTRALLVLSKDNPSDIRELDKSIYIPVILK